MALELDTRQRAMLLEMGVRVWQPLRVNNVLSLDAYAAATANRTARPAAPTSREGIARGLTADAPSAGALPGGTLPAAGTPAATPANRTAAPGPSQTTAYPERRAFARGPGTAAAPAAVPAAVPVNLSHIATLDWTALTGAVRTCQACTLCRTRSHASIAPLTDALPCDWMLVSDPPDEEEDRTGHPFAGADGQLLNNMLRALGLHRANAQIPTQAPPQTPPQTPPHSPAQRAYVSHALKCRPPHGTIAEAGQLAQCAAYLQREIALVQPKMILSMGRFANQLLLSESPTLATQPLGKQRGTLHHYQGIPLVVTYSPKQLMRNQADKAKAWADLCFAADVLVAKY